MENKDFYRADEIKEINATKEKWYTNILNPSISGKEAFNDTSSELDNLKNDILSFDKESAEPPKKTIECKDILEFKKRSMLYLESIVLQNFKQDVLKKNIFNYLKDRYGSNVESKVKTWYKEMTIDVVTPTPPAKLSKKTIELSKKQINIPVTGFDNLFFTICINYPIDGFRIDQKKIPISNLILLSGETKCKIRSFSHRSPKDRDQKKRELMDIYSDMKNNKPILIWITEPYPLAPKNLPEEEQKKLQQGLDTKKNIFENRLKNSQSQGETILELGKMMNIDDETFISLHGQNQGGTQDETSKRDSIVLEQIPGRLSQAVTYQENETIIDKVFSIDGNPVDKNTFDAYNSFKGENGYYNMKTKKFVPNKNSPYSDISFKFFLENIYNKKQ